MPEPGQQGPGGTSGTTAAKKQTSATNPLAKATPGWGYVLAGGLIIAGSGTRFAPLIAGFVGVAILYQLSAILGESSGQSSALLSAATVPAGSSSAGSSST
jgi:hypothetical protein